MILIAADDAEPGEYDMVWALIAGESLGGGARAVGPPQGFYGPRVRIRVLEPIRRGDSVTIDDQTGAVWRLARS